MLSHVTARSPSVRAMAGTWMGGRGAGVPVRGRRGKGSSSVVCWDASLRGVSRDLGGLGERQEGWGREGWRGENKIWEWGVRYRVWKL